MPSLCTVTATLHNASGTALATSDTFLRFILRNYQGFVPRIAGAAILTETQIDAAPNGSGQVSVTIWGNDNIDPANTFYTVEQHTGGRITSRANYLITGTSFDLDSASQMNPPNPPSTSQRNILLQTSGVDNGNQYKLNLHSSDSSITLTDDGLGSVDLKAAAAGAVGSVSIAKTSAPATLDVTAQGTKDWCVLVDAAASTDPVSADTHWHWKMLGGALRRAFKLVFPGGTSTLTNGTLSSVAVTATAADDAHTTGLRTADSLSSDTRFVRINANTNSAYTNWGFTIEVPANPTARTLRIYMALQSATATITARLSDGSASDATDTLVATSNTWSLITIPYSSAAVGQRLNVSILITTFTDSSTGISFQAATLA